MCNICKFSETDQFAAIWIPRGFCGVFLFKIDCNFVYIVWYSYIGQVPGYCVCKIFRTEYFMAFILWEIYLR